MDKKNIFSELVNDLNETGIATLNWGLLSESKKNVENIDDAIDIVGSFITSGFNVYSRMSNNNPIAIHITTKERSSKSWVRMASITK